MQVTQFLYVAYMYNLIAIFVSDTYMGIRCEVDITVDKSLVYMCSANGSICGV